MKGIPFSLNFNAPCDISDFLHSFDSFNVLIQKYDTMFIQVLEAP